jgi:hypothetical protein
LAPTLSPSLVRVGVSSRRVRDGLQQGGPQMRPSSYVAGRCYLRCATNTSGGWRPGQLASLLPAPLATWPCFITNAADRE